METEEGKTYHYEFVKGTSSKFWEITVEGDTYTVTYGRIGTEGRSLPKKCADLADALAKATEIRVSKEKKGYLLK